MSFVLSAARLQAKPWRFSHLTGMIASEHFRFLANGEVGGYDHANERFWRLRDGVLELLNGSCEVTVRFDVVEGTEDRLRLSGAHLPAPDIMLCLDEQDTAWPRRPGTKAALADRIRRWGWDIGEHTYGVPWMIEEGQGHLVIGKYTSMAEPLRLAFADHRTDTVSTYPFVHLNAYWPSAPKHVNDHVSKGEIRIGNDVWTGADAFIMAGVTIGDGAVIGAKSMITRDVPPYAVVVGTNRIVRYRFDKATIAALLDLAWWNWPDEVVDRYLPLMMSNNIQAFLEAAKAERGAR
jgi:acetyltransferase-like isoleucine patch superfamily enzyme